MRRVVLASILVVATSCATIMHGSSQDIGISSSPTGARVSVDDSPAAQTPYVAKLSRNNNHIVRISMDGYAPAELTLTKSVSGWVWGNIVFGGLIGLAVDAITGGLYNLEPAQLQTTLARQGSQVAPTINGVYVVLVKDPGRDWHKIGQLTPVDRQAVGSGY